jgi:(p)ppGpp synthase/HD superfamily hydrolase
MSRITDILTIPEQLELAKKIAHNAHAGQQRKFGKKPNGDAIPYIVHPERVATKMKWRKPNDATYQIVAWLHDVLEDTQVTREELIERGIGEESVVMVETLSRRHAETYYEFIMRMRYSHMSRKVKIADIEDNMNDGLKEGSMKDKYRLALFVLKQFEEEAGKKNKREKKD